MTRRRLGALAAAAAGLLLLLHDPALAQRHPFAVGGQEAMGAAGGLAGLILAWQNKFHAELQAAARALGSGPRAVFTLAAASFAYGIFHAAGPGHGKAVLASYMVANEIQLRRGLLLAALAALLQGLVAIALVAVAALVFDATAGQMTGAAQIVEIASYVAIAALGARLVWIKGRGLLALLRAPARAGSGRFICEAIDDPAHIHGPGCGHAHAPDPAQLSGARFRWSDAFATVVAAGLRPCSGAILVLVFTLSQGMFAAGAGAVMAMSAGTALTTGALAALAVHAKSLALRLTGDGARRTALFARMAEFGAALLVLGLGIALLLGLGLSRGGAA
ncbi:high frequency lysogenization protein HflD [Methylocystis sp. IM3]|uniref:nickel/cobalt transporter n=1 Tax=unclassified Methylocystis TaxID=2625913 RepID=UPI0030F80234